MKIAFYGGQTAGYLSLLSLIAKKHSLITIYAEDEKITQLARLFKLPTKNKQLLDNSRHIKDLSRKVDLLVCAHARKILKKDLVETVPSINLHPCLYKYKGGYPIQRLIKDGNSKASVACHWMVEQVDAGKTIIEEFKIIKNVRLKTESEIYNELYPLYVGVLLKSIRLIQDKKVTPV